MNRQVTDEHLSHLNKYKYGLLVMMVIFVLSLAIRVQYGFVERPDINELLHRKTDDVIELKLEPVEVVEERMNFQESDVKNATRNENNTESQSESMYQSYYSSKSMGDIERSVYDLEQAFFEESGGAQMRASIQRETEQRKQEIEKESPPKPSVVSATSSVGNATKGNVLVSYSLKGRTGHYVPAPGYMCPQGTSGKVIVKIKVDGQGKVVDAKTSSASSTNECMIAYALEFARKSKFNYMKETAIQEGTITYTFVN